ncbi:hypothetical protein JB92DRAFT_2832616 [Gautieria morchelliformis]|nr:hypothetical protein JB92DRAFT_2832616 [Gautieria morchelliformis]
MFESCMTRWVILYTRGRIYAWQLSFQNLLLRDQTLYEFAWAAISKRTLTTVLAAVKLEDTHRFPDPSIELSPVQIQEGPFFEPWKRLLSYPLSRMFIGHLPHTPSAGPPAHLLSSLPISSTELLTPSVPSPLSSAMQPPRSPPPAGTEILSENMPQDFCCISKETTTKREHSELEEVSNPWSKRLRTRK